MPPRKKKTVAVPHTKPRNLFTHLKELTEGTDENYWTSLTDQEKREFTPYMTNRWLSMIPEWIELIDDLQRLTVGPMPKERVFDLYHEILPKGKVFFKYVKGKNSVEIPEELAGMLLRYFECSPREMREYYVMLMKTKEGQQFLVELMQGYGTPEKELKRLRKEIGL